jgi:UDP-2-acetamido-3-amino-2,3-dideoxy-glucuronate N-acetyltransferase
MLTKRGLIYLHSTAIVDSELDGLTTPVIGPGTRVWAFAHLRSKARIGADCSIGKGCSIEGVIGDRVRVQNHVSIFDGVVIESDVFIGPHVTFTNDRNPRVGEPWQVESTLVQHHASIGAGVTVRCGVSIGEYAMVAAGSVVTANVMPFSLVRGNPARPVGFVCRRGHPMKPKNVMSFSCERCGDGLDVELRYFRSGGGDVELYPRAASGPR